MLDRLRKIVVVCCFFVMAGCASDPYSDIDPQLLSKNSGSLTMAGGLVYPNHPSENISKEPFEGAVPMAFCNGPFRSTIFVRDRTAEAINERPDLIRTHLPSLASVNSHFEVCGASAGPSMREKIVGFFQNPLGRDE